MINCLLVFNSKCECIITQFYKHMDATFDDDIKTFKSKMRSNKTIYDNECVLLINNYSFIFIKYNDIILCVVTNKNCNVFNMLSFEYKLIEIIEQYINNNTSLNSSIINNNIILVLEILNEMILDGYPQQIFDEKYLIHPKPPNKSTSCLEEARMCREILSKVTGACPWRACGQSMGFSVGGAKDINNFRDCINKQILPKSSSLTYNGLFYDYYFQNINDDDIDIKNNNDQEGDNKLFYPSYCYAKCDDDYYISVGLNSNIKASEFKRNKLNLMMILDISGSMKSTFRDGMQPNDMIEDDEEYRTKIDIAKHCLIELISKHIHNDDRFSILLFNHKVYTLQEFVMFKDVNKDELITKIKNIKAFGGTNLENPYKTATEMFDKLDNNDSLYDKRIIYLTDAKSNLGYNECKSLIDLSTMYSSKSFNDGRICTTFIGIGIDFDTDLVNTISTKLYGCNYYAVHSFKEWKKTMLDEFDLMVAPLIFDLKLEIKSEGNNYFIQEVYGDNGDNKDDKNGELMNVKTLFPSRCNAKNEVKGGIILVKVVSFNKDDADDLNMELMVSYKDRFDKTFGNKQFVTFNKHKNDMYYYNNNGVRKAILLIKYIDLLKQWISDNDLFFVSKVYRNKFHKFVEYLKTEIKYIKDETLQKEVETLQKLITASDKALQDGLNSNYLPLSRRNEVSLQVSEKINVFINNTKILSAKCIGKISMNSSLMGMPQCTLGLYIGANNEISSKSMRKGSIGRIKNMTNWKYHPCIRLNTYSDDKKAGMKCLRFIPPDGQFDIASYVIEDNNSIDIPFDIEHNIKHKYNYFEFDVTLKPKFESYITAKDIVIKIPVSTSYGYIGYKNSINTKYGKCELKDIDNDAYLVWNINTLHSSQTPRLNGRIYFNKFGFNASLLRTTSLNDIYKNDGSSISLDFRMNKRITSCVKVMYFNVMEPKFNYKTQRKIKYMIETDEMNNIKYKI